MPHVDEGVLNAYLDGELVGAERDQVLAHLSECATCRTRLDEERALMARAGELLRRASPPTREPAAFAPVRRSHAPSWRVPAAWAATVTIAFVVGWYAQGERLAHEVAERPTQSEARAPTPVTEPPAAVAKSSGSVAQRHSGEPVPRAAAPAAAARPSQNAADRRAADALAPPIAAQAATPRDDAAAWQALDADAAGAVLGQAPAVLRGHAVRRMARSTTDDGVILIEQEWKPGIVLRLYERRAMGPSSQRARAAPSAVALHGENLARYVRSLRVEIAGPLASDSLAQLLDSLDSVE